MLVTAARPVFLSKKERIHAHFTVHFVVLLIARIIEQRVNRTLKKPATFNEILDAIRGMKVARIAGNLGFSGAFEQTELTRAIQETFNLKFAYELIIINDFHILIDESKTP